MRAYPSGKGGEKRDRRASRERALSTLKPGAPVICTVRASAAVKREEPAIILRHDPLGYVVVLLWNGLLGDPVEHRTRRARLSPVQGPVPTGHPWERLTAAQAQGAEPTMVESP